MVARLSAGAFMVLVLLAQLLTFHREPDGSASAATFDVSMVGPGSDGFSPRDQTVAAGDTVKWTHLNGSFTPHTTTSDTGLWDSGQMFQPDTFSFTFSTPGDFPYYCQFHGGPGGLGMAGTIHVTSAAPTQTPAPTATAVAASSLSGSVAFQGRGVAGDPRWALPLSVKLFQQGTGAPFMSATPTTSPSGDFIVTDVAPGMYDVEVKQAQSLSRRAGGLLFTAGAPTSRSFGTLLMGDVNDDNVITILDFSLLSASFGKARGQAGFDARADLNGSNVVDILDFSLLSSNFGVAGPGTAVAANEGRNERVRLAALNRRRR